MELVRLNQAWRPILHVEAPHRSLMAVMEEIKLRSFSPIVFSESRVGIGITPARNASRIARIHNIASQLAT
uniref:Uncharacterized protein n=1 Tax=Oryza meridionalis TaxID=40149 RepID=A0A0E0E1G0_9ORYZ